MVQEFAIRRPAPFAAPRSRRVVLRLLAGASLGGIAALGVRAAAATHEPFSFCRRCQGLYYDGGNPNRCPAGGSHQKGGRKLYLVNHGTAPVGTETNWRVCAYCMGLFWYSGGVRGVCPKVQVGHFPTSDTIYYLEYNTAPGPSEQRGWRYCKRCRGLFLPRPGDLGVCPNGGSHRRYPDWVYNLEYGLIGSIP